MRISSVLVLALALVVAGCTDRASAPGSDSADPAAQVIRDAVQVHGGDRFDRIRVEIDFRGDPSSVLYDRGRFQFERRRVDAEGRTEVDRIDNDGASRLVNGAPVQLTTEERATLETQVNSVVYFASLPYRLEDLAVRLRDLGDVELEDRPYPMIEVTSSRKGADAILTTALSNGFTGMITPSTWWPTGSTWAEGARAFGGP